MKLSTIVSGIVLLGLGVLIGWYFPEKRQSRPSQTTPQDQTAREPEKVVAQGKMLPSSGLVNILAPPNQPLTEIHVAEGDVVTAGTELASFAAQETLGLQSQLATSQGDDAKRELDQKILAAEASVFAARSGVEGATLKLSQVKKDSTLAAAETQLQASREKLERFRKLSADPATMVYVSQTGVRDQELALQQAESQFKNGKAQQEAAIKGAELNLTLAENSMEQAKTGLAALKALRLENQSVQISQSIAKSAVKNSRIVAPGPGTILKVNGRPGEALLHAPLLQIGDLSNMVCVAEVADRLIASVKIDQSVTMKSPAFSRPIRGKVASIGRIVGANLLMDPNPLALTDRKTVDVRIEIDAGEDTAIASKLVNLQVTVEISP